MPTIESLASSVPAARVQSAGMAKKKDGGKPARPDDVVRYTALMRRDERARFKYFCERTGPELEEVGARWILERLSQEEKRLGR
jgi:hypothetical protein